MNPLETLFAFGCIGAGIWLILALVKTLLDESAKRIEEEKSWEKYLAENEKRTFEE